MDNTLAASRTPLLASAHRGAAAVLALLLALAGSFRPASAAAASGVQEDPIRPLPAAAGLDPGKLRLGAELFQDRRLSGGNRVSCMSCHDVGSNGASNVPADAARLGGSLRRNTPTLFNSALNFRQFWDGRVVTQEALIDDVIRNPLEMAGSWPDIVAALRSDAALAERFRAVYPAGVQKATVIDALATYLRSLLTPRARFDRYLQGDAAAISGDELRGYQLFKSYGCVSCHQGVNIGGNMFQVMGVMGQHGSPPMRDAGADLGRYEVTRNEADRFVFRVPSLRNVETTAPYFHDGSATTLEDAVSVMFRYQLGRAAGNDDVATIVKFLGTLTGEHEGRRLRSPERRP